jgi:glycosyltransferase involved in cell wall biosynthesis
VRVALDVTALLDPTTGVGAFTHEVAGRLVARSGIEPVGFAASWRGRDRIASAVPPGLRVSTRPMAAQPLRRLWLRLDHPRIEHWTGQVDLVHGPNFVVPPTRAAAVVTVHDLTCVRYPDLVTADVAQYPRLIQRAIDRGAWVHTVSAFVADEVRDHFAVDPEKVVAIHNGPTVLPEPGPTTDVAAGRELATAHRYVLALGTVEPRKDLPTLVQAFDRIAAEHAGLRLVIAGGDGWGDAPERLADAIDRAANRASIIRLGRVTDDQRAALLRGATVFAYPSRYEGFGLPPLEAMAAGTPVVASDAGAIREVVGAAASLVPPGDPDRLAEALTEVIADADRAAALVSAGQQQLAGYSWDRTVDQLVELYERAVNSPSPPVRS